MKIRGYANIKASFKGLFRSRPLQFTVGYICINGVFKISLQFISGLSLVRDETPYSQDFSIQQIILLAIFNGSCM